MSKTTQEPKTETEISHEPPNSSSLTAVSTHDDDPILTLTEAARQLGKSRPTVARWAEEGLIKTFTHGKLPHVRQSEIDRLISYIAG